MEFCEIGPTTFMGDHSIALNQEELWLEGRI